MASPQLQLPAGGFESSDSLMSILEITKESLTEVPQCYVRREEPELPSDLSDKLTPIPTIDMIKLVTESEASDSEIENLHSTCKEWGIFQVVLSI